MIAMLLAQQGVPNENLPAYVQIVSLLVTLVLLGVVLELVRRRRLVERYALIWILGTIGMVALALWRDGLDTVGNLVGVANPVNGIFLIAFGVVFALLLNFSVAVSRLSEETKILAQVVSRLDAELRAAKGESPSRNGGDDGPAGDGAGPGAAGTAGGAGGAGDEDRVAGESANPPRGDT